MLDSQHSPFDLFQFLAYNIRPILFDSPPLLALNCIRKALYSAFLAWRIIHSFHSFSMVLYNEIAWCCLAGSPLIRKSNTCN
ncbi:hypothetical protein HanPSC8_Chr07g0304701 [Helianthus annuus]|nr:hypothetical protein HanPSC8_Chr07g0304701 [Helianthus annuus]